MPKIVIEVDDTENKNIRIGAILHDMGVPEFVKCKALESVPDYAGIYAAEADTKADTEADRDNGDTAPTISDAPAQVAEMPKRRGRPPGVKNGEGKGRTKRTKADRRGASRTGSYTMAGDGGWDKDEPSPTPVTDSLTADERERLIAKLTEDEGYEDDESEYEDEHGVDEVDFED